MADAIQYSCALTLNSRLLKENSSLYNIKLDWKNGKLKKKDLFSRSGIAKVPSPWRKIIQHWQKTKHWLTACDVLQDMLRVLGHLEKQCLYVLWSKADYFFPSLEHLCKLFFIYLFL